MSQSPPAGEATPLHANHEEKHQIQRPATLFGEDSGRFSPLSEKEVPKEDETINSASNNLNHSRGRMNENPPESGRKKNLMHTSSLNDSDASIDETEWRKNDNTQEHWNGGDVRSKNKNQNMEKYYNSARRFAFENEAGNRGDLTLGYGPKGHDINFRTTSKNSYNNLNSLSDPTKTDDKMERGCSEEVENLNVFELARASQELWNRLNTSITVDDLSINKSRNYQDQNFIGPVRDLHELGPPQHSKSSAIDTFEVSIEGSTSSVENIPPSPQKHLSKRYTSGKQPSMAKTPVSMKHVQSTPPLTSQLKSLRGENDEKPARVFSASPNQLNQNSSAGDAQHNNHLSPFSTTHKKARIFSPFSVQARRLAYHHDEIAKSPSKVAKTRDSSDSNHTNHLPCLNFGLQHCRKVSVLLKVSSHPRLWHDFGNDRESSNSFKTPQSIRRKSTLTSCAGSTAGIKKSNRHAIIHQWKEHEGNDEIFDDYDRIDDDGYGPILFPLLSENFEGRVATNAMDESIAKPHKNTAPKSLQHGEVVLVNPNAFVGDEDDGSVVSQREVVSTRSIESKEKQKKRIVGRVTVETARLVAEVSQISSENWARKYKFDDVLWPYLTRSTAGLETHQTDAIDTLSALSKAAVRDSISQIAKDNCENDHDDSQSVLNSIDGHCSAVIFAVGCAKSGKSQTLFGSEISRSFSATMNKKISEAGAHKNDGDDFGLLGIIANEILSSNPAGFLLSILEIVEDDVIRDVLQASNLDVDQFGSADQLKIRHLDKRGAVVMNLTRLLVKSMDEMKMTLLASFKSKYLRNAWQKEGGHGHFIVTVSPISQYQSDAETRGEYVYHRSSVIQLVDLASADRPANNFESLEWKKCHERRLSSVRKSVSVLTGVLRGLLMKANQSSSKQQPLSYRESTLTQLLQTSLQEEARIVILGTVCPSSKSYNKTLATMDFLSRLLRKPGETAHGPFDNPDRNQERTSLRKSFVSQSSLTSIIKSNSIDSLEKEEPNESDCSNSVTKVVDKVPQPSNPSIISRPSVILDISAPDGVFLKSYVSDPRQRLAKLLNTTPVLHKGRDSEADAMVSGTTPNNNSNSKSSTSDENSSGNSYQRYDSVFEQLDNLMDDDEDHDEDHDDQHHYDMNGFLRALSTDSTYGANGKVNIENDSDFDSDPEHNDTDVISSFDNERTGPPSPQGLGSSAHISNQVHNNDGYSLLHRSDIGDIKSTKSSPATQYVNGDAQEIKIQFSDLTASKCSTSPTNTEFQSFDSNCSKNGTLKEAGLHDDQHPRHPSLPTEIRGSHQSNHQSDFSGIKELSLGATPRSGNEFVDGDASSDASKFSVAESVRYLENFDEEVKIDDPVANQSRVVEDLHDTPKASSVLSLDANIESKDIETSHDVQKADNGLDTSTLDEKVSASDTRNLQFCEKDQGCSSNDQLSPNASSPSYSDALKRKSTQNVFVKKVPTVHIGISMSQDSLGSELLVSCRNDPSAAPKYQIVSSNERSPGNDEELGVLAAHGSSFTNHESDSFISSPDLKKMIETFQKEVDTLMVDDQNQTDHQDSHPFEIGVEKTMPTDGEFDDGSFSRKELLQCDVHSHKSQPSPRNIIFENNLSAPEHGSTRKVGDIEFSSQNNDDLVSNATNEVLHSMKKCESSIQSPHSVEKGELAELTSKICVLENEKLKTEYFVESLSSILCGQSNRPTCPRHFSLESDVSTNFKRLIESAKERESLLKSLKVRLESLNTEKTSLMGTVEDLRSEIENMRHERTIIDGDLESANEAISSQVESSELLRTDISRMREEIVQLKAEKESLTTFFDELDEALRDNDDFDCTSDLMDPKELHKMSCYIRGIASMKNRLREALNENNELSQALEESRQNESTIDDLTNSLEKLKSTLLDREARLEKAFNLKDEIDTVNSALRNQVSELKRESERLRDDNEQLQQVYNNLLASYKVVSTEYEDLQNSSLMHKNELSKLKRSLESSEQDRLRLSEQLDSVSKRASEEMRSRIELLKAEFVKRLSSYKEIISSQQTNIGELDSKAELSDQKIACLEMNLSKREEENLNLQRRIDQYKKAASLELKRVEEKLNDSLNELKVTKASASVQRKENDLLQNELSHLRAIMDIAQESVGELNSLKEENEQLKELVKYHEKSGKSKITPDIPSEIKSKRSIGVHSSFHEDFQDDDSIMNERVTALMRENEHNNITLRTLQRENSSLKGSIREFHEIIELMRSEINDLKLTTHDRASNNLTWNDSAVRGKLSSENFFPYEDNASIARRYNATTSKYWNTPQPHRRADQVDANSSLCDNNRRNTSPKRDSATSGNVRRHDAELSAEKELRFKAEEICAGVLANAKTGFEKRDAEIKLLRQKLFKLTNKHHR